MAITLSRVKNEIGRNLEVYRTYRFQQNRWILLKKERIILVSEVNACIFGEKDFLMDTFFHADSVRQYGTVEVLSQRI